MRDAADHSRSLTSLPRPTASRTGLVFAGGRAKRLGGVNKALLRVGGRRIIDRVVGALEPLVDEFVVLTNDDSLRELTSVQLVFDPTPHAGVLTALQAGLSAARGELCLAVACDMPFVSRALFEHMLDLEHATGADVVIAQTQHGLEPMHAVYRRARVRAAIDAALARGDRRMISYFADVHVRELDENECAPIDPTGLAFFNVNTPADLEAAQRRAADTSPPL
jgi:molybdenum cofactor guanylyltransferase